MSQSQGPSPEGLETRFESLIDWVEGLEDQVEEYAKENQALREEIERLDERERELEARLNEVESNTSLLAKAKQDSLSNPEERAVACIQKLTKKADRTGADRVFLTQEEGWDAVNYDVDRTTVYGDFRKAEELLGRPDVVWYKSEPQSSEKDSRLILDRTSGELPDTVAGYTLQEGRGGSTTGEQGDRGGETGQNTRDDAAH